MENSSFDILLSFCVSWNNENNSMGVSKIYKKNIKVNIRFYLNIVENV